MNTNKTANLIVETITAFVLFFFIVSMSVTLTLHFRSLYYRDIDALNIEKRSGLPSKKS